MTDYLARLAARALGHGGGVRPALAPRFAVPAPLHGVIAALAGTTAIDAGARPDDLLAPPLRRFRSEPAARRDESARKEPGAEAPGRPRPERAAAPAPTITARPARSDREPGIPDPTRAAPTADLRPPPPPADSILELAAGSAASSPQPDGITADGITADGIAATLAPRGHRPSATASPRQPSRAGRERVVPAPLPVDDDPDGSPLHRLAADPAAPERRARELTAAPVVRIHIGRVDVRVVPPAPPARRPEPARRGIELADYLARRHRSP